VTVADRSLPLVQAPAEGACCGACAGAAAAAEAAGTGPATPGSGTLADMTVRRTISRTDDRRVTFGGLVGAAGLLALVLFAMVMIILREAAGLARLGRLGKIRHEADSAARQNYKTLAIDVADRLKRLYAGRKDVAWGLSRLAEHEHDIMDAAELLRLTERSLVAPLDPFARTIVASSAKRVSVVTAVSPGALIDMLFVGAENLRMLRRLATLYGARPGTLSLLKLARMVVTHIVLTGGIALGDDVIQQLVGHGLTAKLSARLGEGLFNGALTTRIGIAAIDVCRPLPYIETERPRFRELVAEVAGMR